METNIDNIHIGSFLSSGFINSSNPGHIVLCSQLYPSLANTLWLGEYRNGLYKQWRGIAATEGHFFSLSGISDYSTDPRLLVATQMLPSTTEKINLGSTLLKYSGIYCTTSFTYNAIPNYITATDYSSESSPGTVKLCANLVPENNVKVNIGNLASNRINHVYSSQVMLYTSHDSYTDVTSDSTINTYAKAVTLWVDPSGYVRRGDHPITT